MIKKDLQYTDYIGLILEKKERTIRNITFQVTDDCCCNCSYCYQKNKQHNYMTFNIAKQCIDLLFNMYYENNPENFINQNIQGIILDFIGGEPLLNVSVIYEICKYFFDRCILEQLPWAYYSRISMISNGKYYFEENTQTFITTFQDFLGIDITIDGPEEIHDQCRKYFDNTGNFKDAYKAFVYNRDHFNNKGTKVTISKENLKNINKIINFFINENVEIIHANTIYEEHWNIQDAQIFYEELKKMADILLNSNKDIFVSLFTELVGHPLEENDLQCWCGGNGEMLAFNYKGEAFPCVRFMESSLNNEQSPIIIGDCFTGIYNTEKTQEIKKQFKQINRKTKSTKECFSCPIASGCGDCAAWNYQSTGTLCSRNTNICIMHKARVLANCYYWNQYYKKNNINKKFKLYLSDEECLKIISINELKLLHNLEK